jgi:hypothetical protein
VTVESDRGRTSAWAAARAQGWRERGRAKGRNYQLRAIENGVPMVDIENNVNAAISTAANLIRNTAPYNVNGTNVTVGVWDGGGVRTTHQELTGRVSHHGRRGCWMITPPTWAAPSRPAGRWRRPWVWRPGCVLIPMNGPRTRPK